MNEGKVGAPSEYSRSYIHFLAFLKIGFKVILYYINAEPVISIRKNASAIFRKCPLRRDEVLLIKKLGYEG
jgi:hypothetical protein